MDYAAVVQGTAWLVTYDQGVPAVGQNATAGDRMYRANKAYLYFDTSAIPAQRDRALGDPDRGQLPQGRRPCRSRWSSIRTDAPFPPAPADWLNYGGPVVGDAAVGGVRGVERAGHRHRDAGPGLDRQGRPDRLCADDRPAGAGAGPAWGTADRLIFDCYADDALVVRYVIPPQ